MVAQAWIQLGIALSTWEVRRAGAGRTALRFVPAGESTGGVFPIVALVGKSTLLPEMAFGCFPPRGAGEARLFPRRKPLPKPARSEPENLEGEFPVLGISHPPEKPSARVPRFPSAFWGSIPPSVLAVPAAVAAIPGRREEAGAQPEDAESLAGWRR